MGERCLDDLARMARLLGRPVPERRPEGRCPVLCRSPLSRAPDVRAPVPARSVLGVEVVGQGTQARIGFAGGKGAAVGCIMAKPSKILVHAAAIIGLHLAFSFVMFLGLQVSSVYGNVGLLAIAALVALYVYIGFVRK